VKIFIYHHW